MKRPFIHKTKILSPFVIYAAECFSDIKKMKGKVYYTQLKSGIYLAWFKNV